MSLRLKKRGEKGMYNHKRVYVQTLQKFYIALERALIVSSPDDESSNTGKGKWKGYPEEETIPEGDEPLTPGLVQQFSQSHRRETAEGGELMV